MTPAWPPPLTQGRPPGRLMVQGRGEQASTTGGRQGGQAEPARPLEGLRSVQYDRVVVLVQSSCRFTLDS